jgi:Family of unknown function (DUF5681)
MSSKKSKVGYCRPPKEHCFEKGKSGNPKGRPKGSKNFESLLTRELERAVTVTDNGVRRRRMKSEVMIRVVVDKALKGDLKAFMALHKMINSCDQGARANNGEDASVYESELSEEVYQDAIDAFVQRRKEGQS